MTTTTTTNIVGLLGPHNPHEERPVTFSKVLRLLDPSGEDERLYLLSEDENSKPAGGGGDPVSSTSTLYELVHVLADTDDYDWSGTNSAADNGGGYTSMFVGNFVVNRPLHTFTPVDPLFWVLSKLDPPSSTTSSSTTEQQNRWQPLDQIVTGLNLALPECIVKELLRLRSVPGSTRKFRPLDHLFRRMNLGGASEQGGDENGNGCDEDEVFYKFCPERALAWLRRKQRAVEDVMVSIAVEHKQRSGEDGTSNGTAFDSGFCFGEGDNNNNNNNNNNNMDVENRNAGSNVDRTKDDAVNDPTKSDANASSILDSSSRQRVRDESVQVVCQYLSDSWRDALLQTMELSRVNLEGKSSSSTSKSTTMTSAATTSAGLPTPHLSIEEQLLGVGAGESNKRPQPAPTNKKPKIKPSDSKGMKKMTSFFTKK